MCLLYHCVRGLCCNKYSLLLLIIVYLYKILSRRVGSRSSGETVVEVFVHFKFGVFLSEHGAAQVSRSADVSSF